MSNIASTTLNSVSGIHKSYSSIRSRFVHYLEHNNWPMIRWTILAFITINLIFRIAETVSEPKMDELNETIKKVTLGLLVSQLLFLSCVVNPFILEYIFWVSLPAFGWYGYILYLDYDSYYNRPIENRRIIRNPYHYYLRKIFKVYLFLITSLYCEEYLQFHYPKKGLLNTIKSIVRSIFTNCCKTVNSTFQKQKRRTYDSIRSQVRRRKRQR